MKLDPVMLIAPTRDRASMPTRRAFLFAGGTFVLGSGFGGACGFAMGRESVAAPVEEMAPSGDVELDELRRLAVKAPIEELIERRMVFITSVASVYPSDAVLWSGVRRLAQAAVELVPMQDRRAFSGFLAQLIEKASPRFRDPLLDLVPRLRAIR